MTTKALVWQTFMQRDIFLYRKWFLQFSKPPRVCKVTPVLEIHFKRCVWSDFCCESYEALINTVNLPLPLSPL